MPTEITKMNFDKAVDKWADPKEHALYLAPFFAIQEAERTRVDQKGKDTPIWMWNREKTVVKFQEIVWQLTGEWGARRKIMIKNREKFHEIVTQCVIILANFFNKNGIIALRDMRNFDKYKNQKIVSKIEENIALISKTRPTKKVQPILGSKVIHHFFPSIVPVYDDKMISQSVLKLKSFIEFQNNNQDGWIFKDYKNETRLQEYHCYFVYCAQQICDANNSNINELRNAIAKLYKNLSPYILFNNKQSILWKLDAKIAEYCLIGATY